MLKRSFLIAPILLALFVSAYPQAVSTQTDKQKTAVVVPSAEVPESIGMIEGKVVLVYDGDHLSVQAKDGKVYSIRMQGIDAPEGDQDYGAKARKKLSDIVLNENVQVIVHKKDMYDRYVGSVFYKGQDVGLKMIETGMAWHFKRFSGEQAAEARARYARAELKARNDKEGLWSDQAPIPPWEFREEGFGDVAQQPAEPAKPAAIVQTSSVAETAAPEEPATETTAATPAKAAPGEGVKKGDRTYFLGPRGGCYYVRPSGSKVYVKDKTLCNP